MSSLQLSTFNFQLSTPMKCILPVLAFVLIFASCNWAKQKTKETVNKTGEVVAKTGSEFVNGVSKGIEQTFQNEVLLSDELKAQGLKTGKIVIVGTDSSVDNILSVYFMFDRDFERSVTIKVISAEGQEYGRKTMPVKGTKNDAGYFDFVFDKRTNIDSKGKLLID